jgi:hypothetical protein
MISAEAATARVRFWTALVPLGFFCVYILMLIGAVITAYGEGCIQHCGANQDPKCPKPCLTIVIVMGVVSLGTLISISVSVTVGLRLRREYANASPK